MLSPPPGDPAGATFYARLLTGANADGPNAAAARDALDAVDAICMAALPSSPEITRGGRAAYAAFRAGLDSAAAAPEAKDGGDRSFRAMLDVVDARGARGDLKAALDAMAPFVASALTERPGWTPAEGMEPVMLGLLDAVGRGQPPIASEATAARIRAAEPALRVALAPLAGIEAIDSGSALATIADRWPPATQAPPARKDVRDAPHVTTAAARAQYSPECSIALPPTAVRAALFGQGELLPPPSLSPPTLALADASGLPHATRGRGGPAPLALRLLVEALAAVPAAVRAARSSPLNRYGLDYLTVRDLVGWLYPKGWTRSRDLPRLRRALREVENVTAPAGPDAQPWQPVAYSIKLPRDDAAVTLDTPFALTVTLPPDAGHGPRLYMPALRKYQGDARAWRAYLTLASEWYEASRAGGHRDPHWATYAERDLWRLCYPPIGAPADGATVRKRNERARATLARFEYEGLLTIERLREGWRITPTNSLRAPLVMLSPGEIERLERESGRRFERLPEGGWRITPTNSLRAPLVMLSPGEIERLERESGRRFERLPEGGWRITPTNAQPGAAGKLATGGRA